MFERKKYKNFAKKQLAGRWGIPILVTLVGRIISVKLLHSKKVFASIDVTFDGMVIFIKLIHPLKADIPIVVTFDGIVICFKLLHP